MKGDRESKAFNRLHRRKPSPPQPEPVPPVEYPLPPFQMPDQQRILIVKQRGHFAGQSTWWKRNGQWFCIGATRAVNWIMNLDCFQIERQLAQRRLSFEWRDKPINFSIRSLTAGQ